MLNTQMLEGAEHRVKEQGFKLRQVYFYLVDGCNLRCQHCWIDPRYNSDKPSNKYLDLNLFHSIIKQARPLGLSRVKVTGGEPLLHPQIKEILALLAREDLGLTLETNGTLCLPEMAKAITKCKNPFVAVSIDGAYKDTHEWIRGVKGSFDAAWEGVKNLVNTGIRPQIIMTIMRHNYKEMEPLLHIAEREGAGSVKFNILQPTSRGLAMHRRGDALEIEELVRLGEWVEKDLSRETDLKIIYNHPHAFRPLSKIYGRTKDPCGRCGIYGIIGVLADGSYALCGIGQNVPELIFGDASKDNLEEIWREDPILNRLRSGLPGRLEGVCADCLMKSICLGSCLAQNYYRRGSLFSAFWYCEEAKKRKIFPKARLYPNKMKVLKNK